MRIIYLIVFLLAFLRAEDLNLNTNESESEELLLTDIVYGHVGFFGKTNVLNKSSDDDYLVFSASAGLKYNLFNKVDLNIGVFGMTNILKSKYGDKYVQSKFVTNNVFIKYKDEYMDAMLFELRAGRYKQNRDWLKHYIQGVSLDANYNWVNVWLDWASDAAFVNREQLSDFDVFKKNYNNEWLLTVGVDIKLFGVTLTPYFYFLNKNFWAAGGKFNADFPINDNWASNTNISYTELRSLSNGIYGGDREFNPINNGRSGILWLDQEIKYSIDNIVTIFGLGFVQIWDSAFELANIGNMSRFETLDYKDLNLIEPGGINNGDNSTNMFDANTRTIYAFVGFRMDNFGLMFLGRNSTGNKIQDSYSLSGKYHIIEGLYAGAVITYMTENKINKSFIKGYVEFSI